MGTCAANVRRKVASITKGTIFTVKELLQCGGRNAIYITLSRMVKDGILERLARGTYIHAGYGAPSAREIVKAKLARFGKELLEKENCDDTGKFYTNGWSSSFCSKFGILKTRMLSPRYIKSSSATQSKVEFRLIEQTRYQFQTNEFTLENKLQSLIELMVELAKLLQQCVQNIPLNTGIN